MLNPAIGKLIEMYDSRYQLVHDIAERARKIVIEAEKKKRFWLKSPYLLQSIKFALKEKQKSKSYQEYYNYGGGLS